MAKKKRTPAGGRKPANEKNQKIIEMLTVSYNMEIETVLNYLANSIHLDGIRAKQVKDTLAAEVTAELTHAQTLARRIKVLRGAVPGSLSLAMSQKKLQPPKDPLDVLAVVQGVIAAEQSAIDQYQMIIDYCDGVDLVTQDVCIQLKGDEEEHLQMFEGFQAEIESLRL